MCGINGIVTRSIDFPILKFGASMNQIIRHRGPDDEGGVAFNENSYYPLAYQDSVKRQDSISYLDFKSTEEVLSPKVWLGHRRLSILDLSPLGHCPMSDDSNRYWLTYNGEIYNYIEIRNELKELGYTFISETDTEVVLKAYIQWGEKCVDRFNGMWAFVIYDVQNDSFFGSRDRFGVKPFYYSLSDSVFSFSSEQKALVESGVVEKGINKKAVYDYLAFTQIENRQESFFKNIIELSPGWNIKFSYKTWKLETEQFYDLKFNARTEVVEANKEADMIEEISVLFKNSINLRMRSDVAVGSCLSGGIDSSAIVGGMADLGFGNINTYTACSHIAKLDESHFAQKVVEANQTKWHKVTPTSVELLTDLEELVYCQDIPLFSTSTYAQFRVMKKVKETGVKVVLDGQGGDELFAGYLPHHTNAWLDLLAKGNLGDLIKSLKDYGSLNSGMRFFFKQYLRFYGLKKLPALMYKNIMQGFYKEHNYISDDLKDTYSKEAFGDYQKDLPQSLNGLLKYEFYNTRLKGYLKCEDRCSMWHSVEARTPFSDDIPLIEKVFSISGNYKIKDGVKKHLLKEATKHLLPAEIYNRRDKMGYITPNNLWIKEIKNDLKSYFTEDLEEYYNYDRLMKDYDKFFDQTHLPENQQMFKFIAFAVWKKRFMI